VQVVDHPDYLKEAGAWIVANSRPVRGSSSLFRGADLYVLKRVTQDWSDDVCVGILRRCSEAVAKDGRIVVVDAVVPPGNTPHPSKTVDLPMMVLADGGERTQEEFADLFSRAGLKPKRGVPTPSLLSVSEIVTVGTRGRSRHELSFAFCPGLNRKRHQVQRPHQVEADLVPASLLGPESSRGDIALGSGYRQVRHDSPTVAQ